MKKIFVSHLLIVAVILMLFIPLKSYALDYTISFAGKKAGDMVDSVIVQNLTKGKTVTVPAGSSLNLNSVLNSIDQPSENEQTVRVFPNSARDKSIVLFFAKKSGSTQITVFGIDGKKLIGINKDLPAGENSFQLSLPKGVYAIGITGNGFSYAAKVFGQGNIMSKPDIDFLGSVASVSPKNSEKVQLRNSSATTTTMLYAEGDHLLFKGASGFSKTIVTDVPTQSKTITFNFVDCTDADNNHYAVVQIGTQIWMAENLKTTKYSNGESIGTTTPADKDISGESTPKYQWAYNGDENNATKYGRVYTWYAVSDSRNMAPAGWHVASDAEWTTLENYLIANGYNYDGTTKYDKIAKSLAATTDWYLYSGTLGIIGNDLTKNNSSGFTALPGGYRDGDGSFDGIRAIGYWWSSALNYTKSAYTRYSYYNFNYLDRGLHLMSGGLSVRCVRDY
jgi:uncharacterized protein (TIGR02145 family)